jgi:hypothetical protein
MVKRCIGIGKSLKISKVRYGTGITPPVELGSLLQLLRY